SLMFIWLRSTLPQFASYLSSFKTDPKSTQKVEEIFNAKYVCLNLWIFYGLSLLNSNSINLFVSVNFSQMNNYSCINELAAAQVVVNSFFGGFLWHSMLSFISIFFSGCSSIN
ncbi:hypothetical protein, partial [Lactiplantibacillus plantarum]|uniref:hypothetical protein n=1 Tax=Lactiplantibacillus plantarum TaxID=1590 RepID=UPI0025B45A0E